MSNTMVTLAEFEQMVAAHDLTHAYSDDHEVWRRGHQSLARINDAAKYLNRTDVVRVWNANVDRQLADGAREPFYWRA
jgi:adenine deaminase